MLQDGWCELTKKGGEDTDEILTHIMGLD